MRKYLALVVFVVRGAAGSAISTEPSIRAFSGRPGGAASFHNYGVQFFAPWSNQPFNGTTITTYDVNGGVTSAALNIGVNGTNVANGQPMFQAPQYVTGTFTAGAASETFYPFIPGGGGTDYLIAAMDICNTTAGPSAPEPSALILAGGGLAAVLLKRYRGRIHGRAKAT